jgi:hypothetical protein
MIRVLATDGLVDVPRGEVVLVRISSTSFDYIADATQRTGTAPVGTTHLLVGRKEVGKLSWSFLREVPSTVPPLGSDVRTFPSLEQPPGDVVNGISFRVHSFINDDTHFGFGYKSVGGAVEISGGVADRISIANTYFADTTTLTGGELPLARGEVWHASGGETLKEWGFPVPGSNLVGQMTGVVTEAQVDIGDTRYLLRSASGSGKDKQSIDFPVPTTDGNSPVPGVDVSQTQVETPVAYANLGFSGRSEVFRAGRYDFQDLSLGNDTIKSIRVPPGFRVTLYSESHFWGPRWVTLTGSSNDVSAVGGVSSVVVERPWVAAFAARYFQGAHQVFVPGRYDFGALTVGNDTLSSIRIPPGWKVTAYREAGFWGQPVGQWSSDTPDVGPDFRGQISSIVVEGPAPGEPPDTGAPRPLYRLRNPTTGNRLFTTSQSESADALGSGFISEGVAFMVHGTNTPDTVPLYRLRNAKSGDQLLTVSEAERDGAVSQYGFVREGVAC